MAIKLRHSLEFCSHTCIFKGNTEFNVPEIGQMKCTKKKVGFIHMFI